MPAAPDPVATAAAQSQQNKDAAIAQANLNRIDQYTPDGSITYKQIGTNEDGTPRYQQTMAYSPTQQAIYDQDNAVTLALSKLAGNNIDRVNTAQSQDWSYGGMTQRVVGVNPDGSLKYGPSGSQQQQTQGDRSGKGGGGMGQIMPEAQAMQTGQPMPRDKAMLDGGKSGKGGATGAPAQPQQAGQGNGKGGGQTKVPTAPGAPPAAQAQGGQIQGSLDYSGLSALPGINDFGGEAQRVQNAVYNQATSRLDPRFQQQESDLAARLANQGISNDSEAYRREMDNLGRTKNDAYNQAVFNEIGRAHV